MSHPSTDVALDSERQGFGLMLSFLSADGSNNQDFQDGRLVGGMMKSKSEKFGALKREDMCENHMVCVDDTCGNMGG